MSIAHNIESVSFRNGLFIFFILNCFSVSSQKFDPLSYEKLYPNESFILLDHKVEIELIESEEGPSCKTTHKKEYLSLEHDVRTLNRFLLTFSETQDLKVTMARFYEYEDGKKKLVKNVKTKWLKPRDHFIKGVFFNDVKDLEVSTMQVLNKHTHVFIEYEIIDNDLKFISPIYAANYGEPVVNFSVSLKEPYDALVDLVPFNIEDKNFIYSESDGYTTYTAKKLAKIESGGNTPPYNYIAPHFVPVVREVGDEKHLSSVDDLYKWYKGLIGEVERNTPEINNLSKLITSGKVSDDEKIKSIFKFVQSKIDYLAFEDGIAGFKPASAKEVIKTGYGDCKGMSNLLVDLLKSSGIDAGHAWIGTRRLNYTYDLAALCVDNHMVCWVKHDRELYILDATGKSHLWNKIPSHLQGKQILLGKGETFEVVEVPISTAESNTVMVDATITVDPKTISDNVTGTLTIKGNEAIDYFMSLQNLSVQGKYSDGAWVVYNFMSGNIDEVEVNDLEFDENENTLLIKFKGAVTGCKVKTQNALLLYPRFSQGLVEIIDVNQPVYFSNAFTFNSNIQYELTGGLKVGKLPEAIELNLETYNLQHSYTNNGSSLTEFRKIVVNTIYADKSKVEETKSFIEAYNMSFIQPIQLNN